CLILLFFQLDLKTTRVHPLKLRMAYVIKLEQSLAFVSCHLKMFQPYNSLLHLDLLLTLLLESLPPIYPFEYKIIVPSTLMFPSQSSMEKSWDIESASQFPFSYLRFFSRYVQLPLYRDSSYRKLV